MYEQPKFLSTGKWYIYTIVCYLEIKINEVLTHTNLENVMIKERLTKDHLLYVSMHVTCLQQEFRDRKQVSSCQEAGMVTDGA